MELQGAGRIAQTAGKPSPNDSVLSYQCMPVSLIISWREDHAVSLGLIRDLLKCLEYADSPRYRFGRASPLPGAHTHGSHAGSLLDKCSLPRLRSRLHPLWRLSKGLKRVSSEYSKRPGNTPARGF